MKLIFLNGLFKVHSTSVNIGIMSLVSVCRAEQLADVQVYDPTIHADDVETSARNIAAMKPDMLGISVLQEKTDDIKDFIEQYRRFDRHAVIFIGGHSPTIHPESFLLDTVDSVFVGESEISLPKYIKKMKSGESKADVPGIIYRDENGFVIHARPAEYPTDLDALPFIARDTLPILQEKYGKNIFVPIAGSRGCYMNCTYCTIKTFSKIQGGSGYRERSVDSIVKEMAHLHEHHCVSKFFFVDDNFMPPNKEKACEKIDAFCYKVSQLNIEDIALSIQCRPDNVHPNLLKKLTEVGLSSIFIGIESINERDLAFYGKSIETEKIYHALDALHDLGFSYDFKSKRRLRIGFINFNSFSTRESLIKNLEFLEKYNVTPKKFCTYVKPFYGTAIYYKLQSCNLLDKNNNAVFEDQDIADILATCRQIIGYVLTLRERIRLPNKICTELGIGNWNDSLDQIRQQLDALCYRAFREVLYSSTDEYQNIYNKYKEIIDVYKNDESIILEMQKAEDVSKVQDVKIFV